MTLGKEGQMSDTNRSKRQIECLLRVRDWHLSSALRAEAEGRREEAQFHMQYYRLLGPAVAGHPAIAHTVTEDD
jgi:hypothetical protein